MQGKEGTNIKMKPTKKNNFSRISVEDAILFTKITTCLSATKK